MESKKSRIIVGAVLIVVATACLCGYIYFIQRTTLKSQCMIALEGNPAIVKVEKDSKGELIYTVPGYNDAKRLCKDWGLW